MTLGITDSNPCRNHKLTSKLDIFSLWLLLIFFGVHKSQQRFKLISSSTQLLRIDVDAYGMTPLLAASVTGRDLMLMKTTLAVIMVMISAIMTLVAMMVTVILLATMVTLVAWSISMATVEKLLDVRPDRSLKQGNRLRSQIIQNISKFFTKLGFKLNGVHTRLGGFILSPDNDSWRHTLQ